MSNVIQRSFTAGEISPALYARRDMTRYASGVRTLRNMWTMRTSGAQNRPGTLYSGEVSTTALAVRLIPFVFNRSQAYVLELGDNYMRFLKNGGYLSHRSATVSTITSATTAEVTTIAAHGFADGQYVQVTSVGGTLGNNLNKRFFKIVYVSTTKFTLHSPDGLTPISTVSYGAYTSGGTVSAVYTITTPYPASYLSEIRYTQSADVMTLTHSLVAPQDLKRLGDVDWTITASSVAPAISKPLGVSATPTGGTTAYIVTAIASSNFEESLPSNDFNTAANTGTVTVSWSAVSGALEYNVYKKTSTGNGIFGFLGTSLTTTYVDNQSIPADITDTAPTDPALFNGVGKYPTAVCYYQQRRMYAGTVLSPETVYGSRSAKYTNFTVSRPSKNDDSINFTVIGEQVNQVLHLVDFGTLLVMSEGGETSIQGDSAGTLKPGEVNPKRESYYGSSIVRPQVVDGSLVYVQSRGNLVRDLGYQFQSDGYRGNDLTNFSSHLVEGRTIVDSAYQQNPNSILWFVRDDGVLLGLTYIKEQEIVAWHRHDLAGGLVESIASIPAGSEDALYLVVKRTIGGVTRRYIERFSTRFVSDTKDYVFADASSRIYDGRNLGSGTMTLSSASTWTTNDTLTLTSSASIFTNASVGSEIHFQVDSSVIRFVITGHTSGTVVTGYPQRNIPVSLQNVATTKWSTAVKTIYGLWHLEGQKVSVLADGNVAASPNNASYETITVASGSITLQQAASVITVGLPYFSDTEMLDIDTLDDSTVSDKAMNITSVSLKVQRTTTLFAGGRPPEDDSTDPLQGLDELKIRDQEIMDSPVSPSTGTVEVQIPGNWNGNGRVFIRQVDPLPLTILSVAPQGYLPQKGNR